jgi:hypothetical protein
VFRLRDDLFEAVFDMMIWCQSDFRTRGLLSACACICLILAGCSGEKTTPAGTANSTASGSATTENTDELGGTDDLLKSILDMLKLDALGFTSNEDLVVGLVNQWQRQSQAKDNYHAEEPLDAATLSTLQAQLSSDQITQLRRTAFNKYDIERLRDLLLMRASAQNAAGTLKTDLERVASVFHTLVRNSDLVANHPDEVPLSPFNLYLLGKMTVAERSWLFAELLRQLKIDCVLLTTSKAQASPADSAWDASQPFLIGVLVNKQVYLFDPLMGIPLTVPGVAGKTPEIATLAQVQADPKILGQYDQEEGKPYRISAELLKAPHVLLCGDLSLWSYRLHRLQVAFTGDRSVVISDHLTDRSGQPGLLTRVTNWPAKSWQAQQIHVWAFPITQLTGLAQLSAEQRHALERTIDPLKMPLKAEVIKGKENSQEVRNPTSQFLLARLDHARGHLNDAVKGYTLSLTRMQNPNFRDFPQRARIAYVKATEDIRFWIAVCKLDQGDQRIGTDKLRLYLRAYPQGEWSDACHALLAETFAASGDFTAALDEISRISPEHPQQPGFAVQKRKWAEAAKLAAGR